MYSYRLGNRNPRDAKLICDDINSRKFEYFETPGLSVEKLITLAEISKIPGKRQSKKRPIFGSHDGPSLFVLPDELVSRLSNMDNSELDETAISWAELDDEFHWQGSPNEVVHKLLQNLRAHSQKAQKKKLSLLLRYCP